MKKKRKLKAISVCLILTLAYFWNYGITNPQFVSEIINEGYSAAEITNISNFTLEASDILLFILKL